MSDNIMYDSPTEFLHDVASDSDDCVAQSVIPLEQGGYLVSCCCAKWETTATSREEGLELAQRHTGHSS